MGAPPFTCPKCGCIDADVRDYESMIVIAHDYALFTLRCPGCGQRISGLRGIPEELRDEVRYAAIEVGAGMGRA